MGYNNNKVILRDLVLTGNNVKMLCYDKIEEEGDVTLLPLDTQELVIEECKGIEFLMRLSNCSSMGERMMTDHELMSTCSPFLSLERLFLSYLDEFSGLVKLELGAALPPVGTFSHLCMLHVSHCNKMKKLILRWLLQYLLNLTVIRVCSCWEMEEIMTEDEEEQAKQCTSSASSSSHLPSNESRSIKNDEVVLPKLEIVYLIGLRKLKSIYKGRRTCGSIQCIILLACEELKRLPFALPLQNGQPSAPPALQVIAMPEGEWEALEWDHPEYNNVLHPFFKPLK